MTMRPPPSGRRSKVPKQPASVPVMEYNFPLMNLKEIHEDMEQFDFPINPAQVKNPKPSDVNDIVSFFLQLLYGEAIQRTLEPDVSSLENHPYPSIYDGDVLKSYHFLRALQRMFKDSCYPDFTLGDLSNPDPKRFRYQLSALINYAKYRGTRHVGFEKLATGEDEMIQKHEELSNRLAKTNAEIASFEQSRRDEESEVEQQKVICAELVKHYQAEDAKRVELTKETTTKKAEIKELSNRLKSLEDKVKQRRNEVYSNKQMIVSSPQRIMAELSERESHLENLKNEVGRVRTENKRHTDRESALRDDLVPMRVCEEVAERVAKKRDEIHKLRQKAVQTETRQRQAMEALRDAEAANSTQQMAIDAIEKRRARVVEMQKEHEKILKEDNKKWSTEVEELKVYEADCEHECAGHEKWIQQAKSETMAKMNEAVHKMKILDEKHETLLKAVKQHDEQVRETLNLFEADSKEAVEKLTATATTTPNQLE